MKALWHRLLLRIKLRQLPRHLRVLDETRHSAPEQAWREVILLLDALSDAHLAGIPHRMIVDAAGRSAEHASPALQELVQAALEYSVILAGEYQDLDAIVNENFEADSSDAEIPDGLTPEQEDRIDSLVGRSEPASSKCEARMKSAFCRLAGLSADQVNELSK
jgi:hypothetical protein